MNFGNEEIIQSGSPLDEDTGGTGTSSGSNNQNDAGENVGENESEKEGSPILGKFKSQEELTTAYKELEKKIGEQGNELGNQKQMNAMLLEQMQQRQAIDQTPATEDEEDAFDYESSMSELAKGVEEGDIPIEKALVEASNLAAENATRNALSKYEQMTEQQQQKAAQQKFLNDHPDFLQLQQTGQLEVVKQTLPGMHDDFSAYFAFQADQALTKARAKNEEERIASGDERNSKILNKPGSKAKDIGKPKSNMSAAELKAHTLAKLKAMEE